MFRRYRQWLWALGWMALIFGASTDMGSSRQTSRFIGPIVRWLYPKIEEPALGRVVYGIRKGAHVTEYAILAVLCWRALSYRPKGGPRTWVWKQAFIAWLIAAGYASSDEFHQSFVPSRTGQWQDVVWDSSGAFLGLCVTWGVVRWRRSREPAE